MWIYLISIIIIIIFIWWFIHRDPNRYVSPFEGFLSPADGVVSAVFSVNSKEIKIPKGRHGFKMFIDDFPQAKTVVVIMMKAWHVHTQRSPSSGEISSTMHKSGTFKNAVFGNFDQATIENEHAGVFIKGKKPCKVYLVAGLLARRISLISQQGDKVSQGERIGRISFGSQVVLVLPKAEIIIKTGDRVYAGLTEVAK